MSLAMIARCDAGGLGVISREVFRHLRPTRTLLLDLDDRGRGSCADHAYDVDGTDQAVYRARYDGGIPTNAIDWLCAPGIDTLWTAETFYSDLVLRTARANGIRTVVHAMPELAPWSTEAPDRGSAPRPSEMFIPTAWRASTLPGARLLPVPVARDRLPFRQRTKVAHLFHPVGTPFHDRNGTELLLAALPYVTARAHLTIRTARPIRLPRTKVVIDVDDAATVDYWDQYDPSIDLLVLPRRYGGLCLPVQECASLGVPALMLESDPYVSLPWVSPVATRRSRLRSMKGGQVPVFDADPRDLARAIDEACMADTTTVGSRSWAARDWAAEHAWSGPLGDRWCELLDGDCAREEAA